MNDNDDFADHDSVDEPAGIDPVLRRDRGILWFHYAGSWWQTGVRCLPPDVRAAFLDEMIRRERNKDG